MITDRTPVNSQGPRHTGDLSPSERSFIQALQDLGWGRVECIPIRRGQLVLDPWPRTVRNVKFHGNRPSTERPRDFELKTQVIEFVEYVRSVEKGEIRVLQVQDGIPLLMEIEDSLGEATARV